MIAERLTGPEIRVLRLVALGKDSYEIANALHHSLAWVKKCREIIMDKTQIHDRVLLSHWATAQGYVQNPYQKQTV